MENNKQASAYDFVHPGHKLNTQWPVLDVISQRIASELASSLSERLQVNLLGSASPTTRGKYAECVNALGLSGIVQELSITPLSGGIWFCMDTSVISALVNCYFGGSAELIPLDQPRKLSRTESRVMQHVIDAVVTSISTGWSNLIPMNVAHVKQIDVERLANAALQQVMVTSDIKLKVGEIDLPCQIVYPFETLNPISVQLQKEKGNPPKQDDKFSSAMQRELLNCELEIRGVLAESHITLGTLLELKTGDFIALRDVQTVSFKTQNMPLFDARVGNSNGRVSASVSRWHLPVNS
ncbi:MAG: FliM/FliN family flagellar motor switch protein [Granulosicoccus sp.]